MKRKFLLALPLLLCACAAMAAPASEATIREMFDVTGVRNLVDSSMPQIERVMRSSMKQALGGRELTAEEQKATDAMCTRMTAVVREQMKWETLEPIYIQIYQQSFTQEELEGILAFYKTPAGQALIKKMPVVMQNTMGAMQQMMGPMMGKMQSAVQETVKEIQSQEAKTEKK